MSDPARSVFASGIYHALLGAILVIEPNGLLNLFGLPVSSDIWIRLLGMALLGQSFYEILAARADMIDFFRWSVLVRLPVVIFIGMFVLLGLVKSKLLLLGAVEFLGAFWTAVALRSPKEV